MIPPLDAFLRGLSAYVRRWRLNPQRDEARIAEALRLAAELSHDHPEDEPAAVLFALSRRARALGAAWDDYPLLCAANMARTLLNAELDARPDDIECVNLRLRVAAKQATFDEVRAFIAARLRPLR